MHKKPIIYLSCTFLFFCCFAVSRQQQRFDWLAGTWIMQNTRTPTTEQWVKKDDHYYGISFIVNGQDTIRTEDIEILQKENDFFYVPTTIFQNNKLPIYFKMTSITDSSFIAENPEHYYPQRIGYSRKGNQLNAFIEGEFNGDYQKREMIFIKKHIH